MWKRGCCILTWRGTHNKLGCGEGCVPCVKVDLQVLGFLKIGFFLRWFPVNARYGLSVFVHVCDTTNSFSKEYCKLTL